MRPSFVTARRSRFQRLRGVPLALAALAIAACVHFPEGNATPSAKLPPKPGQSISNTQMCRCLSCLDPACCTREAEDEQTETCAEVDGKIECGLQMKSCGRCQEITWRIGLDKDCRKTQRKECCKKVAARR